MKDTQYRVGQAVLLTTLFICCCAVAAIVIGGLVAIYQNNGHAGRFLEGLAIVSVIGVFVLTYVKAGD